jgi:thioredoxin 1
MSELILTEENFDQSVLQAEKLVLVDFWAAWCGPCRMVAPILEELASEMDSVIIGKVNVDEQSSLAQRFNILSIPTFILFKKGQVIDQFSGAMAKQAFKDHIEKHIT